MNLTIAALEVSRVGGKNMYLLRCFGRALSSTANILETKTITGASSEDLQARKPKGKRKKHN